MMEGLSSEAFSLAGTLGLGKLIVLYDSNNISIEGNTDIAFTEDTAKRFESYGFGVFQVEDGNDFCSYRCSYPKQLRLIPKDLPLSFFIPRSDTAARLSRAKHLHTVSLWVKRTSLP